MELNETYWTERYLHGQTGWDIGYAAPSIIEYFKKIDDKSVKILIAGGGNGYEAASLYELGFKNVTLLDFAKPPLETFQKKYPNFPTDQLIQQDFFQHKGEYDYLIEQTFFCALPPERRFDYVAHSKRLLKNTGLLIGLLFNIPLNKDQPPFGGDKATYQVLFGNLFEILKMDKCYNSIPPRQGSELFIELSPLKV